MGQRLIMRRKKEILGLVRTLLLTVGLLARWGFGHFSSGPTMLKAPLPADTLRHDSGGWLGAQPEWS